MRAKRFIWRYNLGQRWYCDRSQSSDPYKRPPFWFVIVGKGSKPDRKVCRIDVDHPDKRVRELNGDGQTQEYTHAHLKRYGKFAGYEPTTAVEAK